MAEVPALWRRFVLDLALTISVGVLLGIVWILFLRETGPFPALKNYVNWIAAAIGIVVGLLFMRAVQRAVRGYLRNQGDQRHDSMVALFFNLFIVFGILLYLAHVDNVSLQNLFLGSALAGVVLGLASQTLLGNVFAGVTMVLYGPFHVGDRVSIVSASYGAFAPTYPHEMLYPGYTGAVQDVGLLFTVLRLDNGQLAMIPNSVVFQALVLNVSQSIERAVRVRMTFPIAVPVGAVEATLPLLAAQPGLLAPDAPAARLVVADVAPTTWDGVVVIWTIDHNDDRVRDAVLRAVLGKLPGAPAAPATPPKP